VKRALAVIALAMLCTADGQARGPTPGAPWTCSLDDKFDTAGLCLVKDGSGLSLYITDVVAQSTSATAGLFILQYGISDAALGACGRGAATLLPSGLDPSGGVVRFTAAANTAPATAMNFTNPLRVPPGNDLCIIGDAVNSVTVQLVGYLAP
jgi:hypothetical protein